MTVVVCLRYYLDTQALGQVLVTRVKSEPDVRVLRPSELNVALKDPMPTPVWVILSTRTQPEHQLLSTVRDLLRIGATPVLLHDGRQAGLLRALSYHGVRYFFHISEGALPILAILNADERLSSEVDLTAHLWAQALTPAPELHLTAREQDVIDQYLGASSPTLAVVASALGISVNTARVHLTNIRKKLGGSSGSNRQSLRTALEDRGWTM